MNDWELFLRLRHSDAQAPVRWRGQVVDEAKARELLTEAVGGALAPEWQEFLEPFLFSPSLSPNLLPPSQPLLHELCAVGREVAATLPASLPFIDRCLLVYLTLEDPLAHADAISCLSEALHQNRTSQRLVRVFRHRGVADFLIRHGRLSPELQADWELAGQVLHLYLEHSPDLPKMLELGGEHCLRRNRPAVAEFLFRHLLELEEARIKPLPLEKRARCEGGIGRSLLAQGRWPEAEPLLQRAEEHHLTLRRPGNLDLALILTELGRGVSYWQSVGGYT
ncbi:MAG TPA: hypothetical protein PKO06_03820, partial [Candidatus Ozemobacteraceae bacterium]|nr:hypothetical protein [Candidatus Ozemobacteraceae bacterium]